MSDRRGEKLGWIGGWLGGFLWILILAALLFSQGEWFQGALGLALIGAAVCLILWTSPWRHPHVPYWKLMLPIYALFLGSLAWLLWSPFSRGKLGITHWNVFLILPLLIPLSTAGKRRWSA